MLAVISPIQSNAYPLSPTDSSSSDDGDLVRQATLGSQPAFEQLYRRHVKRIYGAIWRLVGGVDARAEELTQEAFIRAWQALPGFRADSAFGTWLYRLAMNTALMDIRSRAGRLDRETSDDALDLHTAAPATPGLAMDLAAVVAGLPPRARAVLVLFDVEGWTHEEISVQLDMAVGSSKAQLHRARALLRQRLGGEA